MSYILDALRRADAERERGHVPSLHAQPRPMPPLEDDDRGPADRRRVPQALWMAVAALLAVSTVLVLWRPWAGAPASQPTPGLAPVQAQAPSTLPAPTAARAPAESPGPAAPPAVAAVPTPAPAAAPSPAAPPRVAVAPATVPQRAAVPPPPPRPRLPPPAAAATARAPAVAEGALPMPLRLDARSSGAPSGPQRQAPAATPGERVLRMAELPDALRRQLPPLSIGGAVHSPDPNARMVIVNGQVRREGDLAAPGLTLVRIRINSAVFEYRGQLFETTF